MSFLTDLLDEINGQRADLANGTGGAQAPAATGNGTGGAQAPDATAPPAAAAGSSSLAAGLKQIAAMSPTDQAKLRKLTGALGARGQQMPANGAKAAAGKFGGRVLGYGQHTPDTAGLSPNFATVLKGGRLFHVYEDGRHVGVDHGVVAQALGIKEQLGAVAQAPMHPSAHDHSGRDGHNVDPVTGQPSWGPDRRHGAAFVPQGGGRETPAAGLMRLLGL